MGGCSVQCLCLFEGFLVSAGLGFMLPKTAREARWFQCSKGFRLRSTFSGLVCHFGEVSGLGRC